MTKTKECPRCGYDKARFQNEQLISRAHLAYAETYRCPSCELDFSEKL